LVGCWEEYRLWLGCSPPAVCCVVPMCAINRWSRNWCLAASAALGRVTLALSAFADDICGNIQVNQGLKFKCIYK
jgi:hypothetical protein